MSQMLSSTVCLMNWYLWSSLRSLYTLNFLIMYVLKRSVYGLKQAPRQWFYRLSTALLALGFVSSKANTSLFMYHHGTMIIYYLVYVDNIIIMILWLFKKSSPVCKLSFWSKILGISITLLALRLIGGREDCSSPKLNIFKIYLLG